MIRRDIQNTDFYDELTADERQRFFYQLRSKFVSNIDNIYYTVKIDDDENGNPKLIPLFKEIDKAKEIVRQTHEPVEFRNGLNVDFKSFKIYKYCLSFKDFYDIFILDYIPNAETPRILVQIRSYGLWLAGWEKLLQWSYESVKSVLEAYGCNPGECYENRIDYCFHTNAIEAPERYFSDRAISKTMTTTMERYHFTGGIEKKSKGSAKRVNLLKDYFALGERKSNYIFIRFYNKALEVIEKGYKSYFFKIWSEQGLISFYDKYCFEYAYLNRNYDYVHKAKLEFYLEYGHDDRVKQEFQAALDNQNLTVSDYRELAQQYMPEVSRILNIEFETKRKFYYLSDDFINQVLPMHHREGLNSLPVSMNRLCKIVDNRGIFLDFLTDNTLKFMRNGDYADWWKRLRAVGTEQKLIDEKLLRDYSHDLDMELMKRRFINTVAGNAVYLDKAIASSFIEDLTDILSNINDNDKYNVNLAYFDEDGEISDIFNSDLLKDYQHKKSVRENRIKTRKKKMPTKVERSANQ